MTKVGQRLIGAAREAAALAASGAGRDAPPAPVGAPPPAAVDEQPPATDKKNKTTARWPS